MNEETVYVIGHKNPDTDSICSAMAYAALCNQLGRKNVSAARAGHLNRQTEHVLATLGLKAPTLLADVFPRVRNVVHEAPVMIDQDTPLAQALEIMRRRDIRMLPVVDGAKRPAGALILKRLTEHIFFPNEGAGIRQVLSSPASIQSGLNATPVHLVAPEQVETLSLIVGAMSIETFRTRLADIESNTAVVFVGDREDIQRLSVEAGVRLLVVTGGLPVSASVQEAARAKNVSILSSPYDTATSTLLTRLSTPARHLAEQEIPTITADARVDELRRTLVRSNVPGALVVNAAGEVSGVATKSNLLRPSNIKLILVDHNELTQAVPGADQVEILEVIDHHRLGNFHTEAPIRFINQPLGSTCSVVATLYRQFGLTPEPQVAGLMLAGLLSDTVMLKSPTTTDLDRDLLHWLGELSGQDPMAFGRGLFQAGSALAAYPDTESLLTADFKEYEAGGRTFGVGQVEVVNFQEFQERMDGISAALDALCRKRGIDLAGLLVTDIVQESSQLLVRGDEDMISLIGYPYLGNNLFELKGVLSRKKQLVPHLLKSFQNNG